MAAITYLGEATRLQPPSELTPSQANEFRKIVESMPSDWFSPGHLAMLTQLSRHVNIANLIAQAIENTKDVDEFARLAQLQIEETKSIGLLMTKLRLTPRSMNPSRTSAKRLLTVETPWGKMRR
jgi:hypothetical protein